MEDNISNNELNQNFEESELDIYTNSMDFSEVDENDLNYVKFIEVLKNENFETFDEFLNFDRKYMEGLLPIHHAVILGNIKLLDFLLSNEVSTDIKLEGIPLLHLLVCNSIFSHSRKKSVECFKHLISVKNELINDIDRLGRSILHIIFQYDLFECLEFTNFEFSKFFDKDFNGDTVIDYAILYNSKYCLKYLIERYENNDILKEMQLQIPNYLEKMIIYNSLDLILILVKYALNIGTQDVILNELQNLKTTHNYFVGDVMSNFYNNITQKLNNSLQRMETSDTISDFELQITRKKSLIIYHQDCLKHCKLTETDPVNRIQQRTVQVENPDRINVLLQPSTGILHSDYFKHKFDFREVSRPASLADILLVHEYNYVESIRNICQDLKKDDPEGLVKYGKNALIIDSDTYLSAFSYDAALQAVGCVTDAVDMVMNDQYQTAFVAIRPPGHHAGYFGKVESSKHDKKFHSSNGFCFFNNIAIGAAYCKYKYKENVKKIAIIDFDVHHANGTEEIIRNLSKKVYKFYTKNQFIENTTKVNICKPWLDENDAENVLLVSIHGYDDEEPGNFYPSSGKYSDNTQKDSKIYPGGVLNIPISGPLKYSHGYRNIFRARVTPRLMKFKPDIIFISAGFDGHENEFINASYMKLNEHDYRWMTEEIMRIANKYCNSKVISVLEGGYNINSGIISSFSQSVMTHVKYLNICNNKNKEELITCKIKRKKEFLQDYENYKRAKKFKTNSDSLSKLNLCERKKDENIEDEFENDFNPNINKYDNGDTEADFLNYAQTDNIENIDNKTETVDFFVTTANDPEEEEIDIELNEDEVNLF